MTRTYFAMCSSNDEDSTQNFSDHDPSVVTCGMSSLSSDSALESEILPTSSAHHQSDIPVTSECVRQRTVARRQQTRSYVPFAATSSSTIGRWSNCLRQYILLIPLLVVLLNIPLSEAVKCYCTDDHCIPYGACDGTVCLVGILRENNQVIRTCGSHPLGCHRDQDDKWTDLCACDQPFCNTFSHLRAHTSQQRQEHQQFVGDPDEVPLVFNRMDRPDDEPAPPASPISTRTSLLTLLLVVVPLTVGGATIMVVAFNYYCHLC